MPVDRLRYGLCLANLGSYADPRAVAGVAASAERSGWEALLVWDHLGFVWGPPAGDPWVLLAAAATTTSRLRQGTAVTPVARRRPQVLAQTVATLDVLTVGRTIFGAGLGGVPEEFSRFGEDAGDATRAARLDEGLELLARLWAGERVSHRGPHFTIEDVALAPLPVRGRIPIWIGGTSSGALTRAARWDGWVADSADEQRMVMSPEEVASSVERIAAGRTSGGAFDIAVIGYSDSGDTATPEPYAAAGATWWLECIHDRRGPPETMLRRVEDGPPRS